MTELIPTASEAEWLAARRQGITASEIAVVMGLSPWSSPYALYHQKLGILPGDDDSPMMERGRVLEPYIAEKFAAAHPEIHVYGDGRTLYRHSERPWQLATPDRLLARNIGYAFDPAPDDYSDVGLRALAEFKTASSMDEWGEPGTDEIPVHYRCQVIWQMDVMHVRRAYVTVLDVPRWQVHEYVIEMDDSARNDLTFMIPAAEEFRRQLAEQDVPDVDWRPATIGALKQLHPSLTDEERVLSPQLQRRWHAACRNEKHWEQRKKLYEAQIREQLGTARRASTADGVFGRRDVYEVREHVRKASTTDKLVPVYPKKES